MKFDNKYDELKHALLVAFYLPMRQIYLPYFVIFRFWSEMRHHRFLLPRIFFRPLTPSQPPPALIHPPNRDQKMDPITITIITTTMSTTTTTTPADGKPTVLDDPRQSECQNKNFSALHNALWQSWLGKELFFCVTETFFFHLILAHWLVRPSVCYPIV